MHLSYFRDDLYLAPLIGLGTETSIEFQPIFGTT